MLLARALFPLAFIVVDAVLEELGGGAVERQHDILPGLVAGLLDRLHDEAERVVGRFQVRRKAAFVAHIGVVAGVLERRPSASGKSRRPCAAPRRNSGAHRHDHEFLEIDRVVGMHAAIDDVHHRHRQEPRRGAADIAIERQAVGVRPRPWPRRATRRGWHWRRAAPCWACRRARSWSRRSWPAPRASMPPTASKISPLTASTALRTPLPR